MRRAYLERLIPELVYQEQESPKRSIARLIFAVQALRSSAGDAAIVIHAGKMIAERNDPPRENVSIVIDNGRIARVGFTGP